MKGTAGSEVAIDGVGEMLASGEAAGDCAVGVCMLAGLASLVSAGYCEQRKSYEDPAPHSTKTGEGVRRLWLRVEARPLKRLRCTGSGWALRSSSTRLTCPMSEFK